MNDCKYCNCKMKDLTNGYGAGRNFICLNCGAHFYNKIVSFLSNQYEPAKWYSEEEWAGEFNES